MKKTSFIILLVLIIILSTMSLVACNNKGDDNTPIKLSTPTNLQTNSTTLSWGEVENAIGYTVDIDGTTYDVIATSYSLSTLTMPKTYQIMVMAKGDGVNYTDSDWSSVKPYTVDYPYDGTEGLVFTLINDGTACEVSGGTATDKNIIIPSTYQGKPVVKIADNAFEGMNIESIDIPDSITEIGNNAFSDCVKLTIVMLPDSLLIIGDEAFSGCILLTFIIMPENLTGIGDNVFDDCTMLDTIFIPGDGVPEWGNSWKGNGNANVITGEDKPSDDSSLIIFNGNGATGGRQESVFLTPSDNVKIVKNITRIGYTLIGFRDSSDNFYSFESGECEITIPVTSIELQVIVLFAVWEANTYTVSFSGSGASGNQANVTATYDSPMPALGQIGFTRDGYTFGGYYDALPSGKKYYNADGTSATIWDKAQNITLYALWTKEPNADGSYEVTLDAGIGVFVDLAGTYTIEFDLNGESGITPTSQLITAAQGLIYPSIPESVGLIFAGWYENEECTGNPFDFSAAVTASKTLYAKWQQATSYQSIPTIGTNFTGSYSGTTLRYYAFVPLVTQTITIGGTVSGDYYLGLYNSSKTLLGSRVNIYGSSMPTVSCAVTAGNLYYIGIGGYNSSSSGSPTVSWRTFVSVPTAGGKSEGSTVNIINVKHNQPYGEFGITPILANYTFGGWWTAPNGSGELVLTSTTVDLESEHTLYAKWTATVTFDKQEGDGGSDSAEVIYESAMPSEYASPTKYGFIFAGYYDAIAGGTQYYDHNMASVNAWDKTAAPFILYARWTINSFTVTLNKQNGSGGTTSVTAVFGDDMPSATAPTRVGYTFGGYFSDVDGEGVQYYDSDMLSITAWNMVSNGTIYAYWVGNTYVMTLDKRDGTGGDDSADVIFGSPMPSGLVAPTRDDYIFTGYYDSVSGGTQYYGANMESIKNWDKAIEGATLYARWVYNSFTVTLNMQSGTGGTSSVTAKYGEDMPDAIAPTRNGYTFNGYFSSTNGSGDLYYDTDMVSEKTWDKLANTTLYAYWVANTYTITFDMQEGLGGTESIIVSFGSAMPSAAMPTLEGYNFAGYYNAVVGGTQYYNSSMNSSRAWDIADDAVLYARWTAKTFTITFDRQGGTSGSTSATATYGQLLPSATAPTRTGYAFMGYFDAMEDGTQYYTADMTREMIWLGLSSITLYAKWLPANTVTLNKQSGTGGTSSVNAVQSLAMPTATSPSRTGYSFAGYYDAIEGGTQYYTAQMESAKTWDKDVNTTLYARWVANIYTVLFDKQEGSGGGFGVEATYDQAMPYSVAPSRSGLVFVGYYDSQTGGKKYYDGAMASANNWDKTSDTTLYARWANYASGTGTEIDPFLISNIQQLSFFEGHEDMHFAISNDINLNGAEWTPISTFGGILDGRGHKIYNFKITGWIDSVWYYGLFSTISGTIKDLGLENFNISFTRTIGWGTAYVGGFSGSGGTFINCYSTGNITISVTASNTSGGSSGIFAGGLVGSGGSFSNCYATGNVSCTAKTSLVGSGGAAAYAGGLTGSTNLMIDNSFATGSITAYASSSSASDSVEAAAYAGGLVGKGGNIANSYATGAVTATASFSYGSRAYAGGLVGYKNSSTISNSYATGNVHAAAQGVPSYYAYSTSDAYAGGLVGYHNSGNVSNSFSTGNVTGSASKGSPRVDGLMTNFNGFTTNCYWLQTSSQRGVKMSIEDFNDYYFYVDTLDWDSEIWNLFYLNYSIGRGPSLSFDTETTDVVISFDSQGGNSIDSITKTVGAQYGVLPVPCRTGYVFIGWWTNVDGKGREITSEAIVERGNHTLYAKWVAITNIEIIFDLQGGTGSANTIYVTFNSAYGTLASFPTKEGCIFGGWWTGIDGTGENITAASTVSIAENHTLYAYWTPIE